MGTTIDLLEAARKDITGGLRPDPDEQEALDALSAGERMKWQEKARARALAAAQRQIRGELVTHGEKARKHYATMSPAAQDALGVTALLRAPRAVGAQPRTRARGAGRPAGRGGSRRSSARSGDSGSEDREPEPPQAGRLCENTRCEKDISRRPGLALYCNDACQQAAWRDRQTVAHLDELVGTVASGLSCTCSPKRNVVIGGMCHHCGRPRGVVTRDWLYSDMQARSFVSSRTQARKPRLCDGNRHPKREFVDKSIFGQVAT